MATEIPMTILDSGKPGKWFSSKDVLPHKAVDELGLLLESHKIQGNEGGDVPNRSGSAPPSLEGSFMALQNLIYQKTRGRDVRSASFDSGDRPLFFHRTSVSSHSEDPEDDDNSSLNAADKSSADITQGGSPHALSPALSQSPSSPQVQIPPLYNAAAAAYMASGSQFYSGVNSYGLYTPQYNMPGGYVVGSEYLLTGYPFHSSLPLHFDATSPREWEAPHNSYYGSPTSPGVVPQFPVGGPYPFGWRNLGVYSRWEGQRGGVKDPKRYSFFDELKANINREIELSDIAGCVVECSVDQQGSRFIQQKLENCSTEDKESVFKEVLPHASKLITDVFGNYVVQKFLEFGTPEQREELASQLSGQILPLSLQMYGCRVIQKALEVFDLDQKTEVVNELDGHVMECMQDQNANHVIQKCIECVPTEKIGFIMSAFRGQVAMLSTHPFGCRVIQRVIACWSDDSQSQFIVDEILESAYVLAQDQYGNYVIQHVLRRGHPHERSQIIGKLAGKVVELSHHKHASNIVEKCLEHGDSAERELLIEEILNHQPEGKDSLLIMMKDRFANYVVQKILEISTDEHREILQNRIKVHLCDLRKYTYGRHIVTRFEQLFGKEAETKL